jgi:hypothetical protein
MPSTSARTAQIAGLRRQPRTVAHRALRETKDRMLARRREHKPLRVIADLDQRLHVQIGTEPRDHGVDLDRRKTQDLRAFNGHQHLRRR